MGYTTSTTQLVSLLFVNLFHALAVTTRIEHEVSHLKGFRRHLGSLPIPDWELGLREALYQALLRERIVNTKLRDLLYSAPLVGRQNSATPFGDIAVIARGQFYSAPGGFQLVQDPYQNDCDGCHNFRRKCDYGSCEQWQPEGHERLLALWTVKRIRHRDSNFGFRYELEYKVSPVNVVYNEYITKRNGRFEYGSPGHTFIIRADPREYHPSYQKPHQNEYENHGKFHRSPDFNYNDDKWTPNFGPFDGSYLPPPSPPPLPPAEEYYPNPPPPNGYYPNRRFPNGLYGPPEVYTKQPPFWYTTKNYYDYDSGESDQNFHDKLFPTPKTTTTETPPSTSTKTQKMTPSTTSFTQSLFGTTMSMQDQFRPTLRDQVTPTKPFLPTPTAESFPRTKTTRTTPMTQFSEPTKFTKFMEPELFKTMSVTSPTSRGSTKYTKPTRKYTPVDDFDLFGDIETPKPNRIKFSENTSPGEMVIKIVTPPTFTARANEIPSTEKVAKTSTNGKAIKVTTPSFLETENYERTTPEKVTTKVVTTPSTRSTSTIPSTRSRSFETPSSTRFETPSSTRFQTPPSTRFETPSTTKFAVPTSTTNKMVSSTRNEIPPFTTNKIPPSTKAEFSSTTRSEGSLTKTAKTTPSYAIDFNDTSWLPPNRPPLQIPVSPTTMKQLSTSRNDATEKTQSTTIQLPRLAAEDFLPARETIPIKSTTLRSKSTITETPTTTMHITSVRAEQTETLSTTSPSSKPTRVTTYKGSKNGQSTRRPSSSVRTTRPSTKVFPTLPTSRRKTYPTRTRKTKPTKISRTTTTEETTSAFGTTKNIEQTSKPPDKTESTSQPYIFESSGVTSESRELTTLKLFTNAPSTTFSMPSKTTSGTTTSQKTASSTTTLQKTTSTTSSTLPITTSTTTAKATTQSSTSSSTSSRVSLTTPSTTDDFLGRADGKVTKPIKLGNNFDFDIFGEPSPATQPKQTTKTTFNSKEVDDIFGADSPSSQKESKEKNAANEKVIFDNFFLPPTTPIKQAERTEPPAKTTVALKTTTSETNVKNVPIKSDEEENIEDLPVKSTSTSKTTENQDNSEVLTSQSYSTSISFQVNKNDKPDRRQLKLSKNLTVVTPTPCRTTEAEMKNKEQLDALTLSLVNHAKSIDYLHSTTDETIIATNNVNRKGRSRSYINEDKERRRRRFRNGRQS